jgi:cytidine deaminase
MEFPNSPMQLQREHCRQLLNELKDGETVTLTVQQYRDMVTQQLDLHDLIAHMSNFIQEHVSDY